MPSMPLPQNVLDLLAQPNPAVMATLATDGRPVTVATWYLLEPDGTILLGLDAARARLSHLRRDPVGLNNIGSTARSRLGMIVEP